MTTASSSVPARRPLAGRLMRGASWALMNRMISVPAAVVSAMLLARLLSPTELGAYFLAFSLASLLAIIAQFGMARATVKLVAAAIAQHRPAAARRTLVVSFAITLAGGAVLAGATADGPGHAVVGLLEDGERLAEVLPLLALLVPAFALIDLCAESLRGFHDMRSNSLLNNLLTHRLLLMAALAVFWLMDWPGTLSGVLLIAVAIASLVTLLGIGLVWRHFRRLELTGEPPPVRDVLRGAPHFLLIRLNFWLMSSADLWILGMYRPPEEVALYGAAFRIAAIVGVPLLVGNAVLAPVIAELYAKDERARLERVVRSAASLAFMPALVLVLIFVFAGETALTWIYTSDYAAAAAVLSVLVIGRLIHTVAGACGLCLTMTNHQRDAMLAGLATSALGILAYFAVIPTAGAVGAAAVTAGALIAYNVLLTFFVWRRMRVRSWAILSPTTMREAIGVLVRARRGRAGPSSA